MFIESPRLKLIHSLPSMFWKRRTPTSRCLPLKISSTAKVFQRAWPRWNLSNRWEKSAPSKMRYLPPLMKLVSHCDANWWRNRKSENGINAKKTSNACKTKDWTFFRVRWLSERRTTKRNTRTELKKFAWKRLKSRSVLLPKFRERELRFSERCIRLGRILRLRATREILSKIMRTLAPLCMPLLQEMVYRLIKKRTNMRFSLRH